MAAFFKPIFILYNFESCFKTCRFLDFLIKLSMFNQKRKTISAVSLFWNHLSADKGKPRRRFSLDPFQPSKGLRPLQTPHDRNHAVPRFMSGGVEQILRDVSAPRLRAEYLLRLVLFWYVECFVSEVISPKFSFIFCQSQNVVSRNIIEFCKFYNVARLNLIFSNFIPPVLFLLYSYCIGYLLCEKFFTLHLCSFFKTFLKKYVIKV